MSAHTFVVGTAGHVDHGKSSLVRALTGTDPDRLAEEQLRQMTIDLGFAELETPAGNRVHLVDVPGHERFVRNMLAGAGGIDAALLAIAADDGPMPQTREHLDILNLLGIERGVVALTKADLAESEWLDFVTESIRELLRPTALRDIEIVPVSSATGEGLVEIQHALDRVLSRFERPIAGQIARLPIDRVFSMSGFGTVVTGTLTGASLRTGDRVEVSPGQRSARIRGLQTFGAHVDVANPGSRVAVNLSGMEISELSRGDVVSHPGALQPAMRLDARVRLLKSSERALAHNDDVLVFVGSAELPAKVAILEGEELDGGGEAWVQLRLARPIVVLPGDRFVLRRPSPPETIGGGTIVELDPPRHKRNQADVVARLQELAAGDPSERFLARIGRQFVHERQLLSFPLGVDESEQIVDRLLAEGRLRRIAPYFAATERVAEAQAALVTLVDGFHCANPLDAGMPRELLRESAKLERPILEALLSESEELELEGPIVRRVGFHIGLDVDQQRRADAFLTQLRAEGFQPPTFVEAGVEIGLVRAMAHLGWIVEIGDDIVFTPERLFEARVALTSALAAAESISLAEYRDLLGTTRRYAQALLEYFDRQHVTRRIGDRRVAVRPTETQEDAASR